MSRALFAAFALFLLLTAGFSAMADDPVAAPGASASALLTGGDPVLYAETGGSAGTFQRDFDGGYSDGDVSIGFVNIEGAAGDLTASSRVSATGLSLIGGRIAIESIAMSVAAGGDGTGVTEASVTGLLVDGKAVAAGPGTRVYLAGYGTLILFEQIAPAAGAIRANALRLEPDGSGPAASGPVSIGNLSAAAPTAQVESEPPAAPSQAAPVAPSPEPVPEAPPAPPVRAPDPEVLPTPAPAQEEPSADEPDSPTPDTEGDLPTPVPTGGNVDEFSPTPETAPLDAPRIGLPVRPLPREVGSPDFSGYVFPVFGDNVSFGNDYGAPRAVTGWHHGNDLYAPTGTPVLAVADGELFLVGVNRLGGNRLWLRDDAGNEFYYAHLSAYTPLAADGARVKAGDAIGFIGNSGQAITTPPHLHFEVHPGGLDSVNPYPYLLAWQRRADVPRAFREATVAVGQAPAAGALVIEVTPDRDVAPKSESGLATPVS